MHAVEEALSLVLALSAKGRIERVAAAKACGLVLAKPALAQVDCPPFTTSAMDGYALQTKDTKKAFSSPLCCIGDIPAGSLPPKLLPHTCLQIATGAMLPPEADAVVEKECVEREKEWVRLKSPVERGRNIRKRGEVFRKREPLLPAYTLLSPLQIGLLHQGGVQTVSVFSPPQVALVRTGDEVQTGGKTLSPGKVFDTSWALRLLLEREGVYLFQSVHVKDSTGALLNALQKGLQADCLLTVGGVSVGEKDLVRPLLKRLGVQELLCKVNQKPGKPLYIGKKGKTVVFSLPGNPLSSLICYLVYALPYLQRFMRKPLSPTWEKRELSSRYEKRGRRAQFLLAKVSREGKLIPLPNQPSHSLTPFSEATHLAYFPAQHSTFEKGTAVRTLPLPL